MINHYMLLKCLRALQIRLDKCNVRITNLFRIVCNEYCVVIFVVGSIGTISIDEPNIFAVTNAEREKKREEIQFKSIQFHFRVLISLGLSVKDELYCYLHNTSAMIKVNIGVALSFNSICISWFDNKRMIIKINNSNSDNTRRKFNRDSILDKSGNKTRWINSNIFNRYLYHISSIFFTGICHIHCNIPYIYI